MNKIVLFSLVFLVLICLAGMADAQRRRRLSPEERRRRKKERQERKQARKAAKLARRERRKQRRAERLAFLNRAREEEERQRGLRAKTNDDLRVRQIDESQEQVDFDTENIHRVHSNLEFSFKNTHNEEKGGKTSFHSKSASRNGLEIDQDKSTALEEIDRSSSKKAHETELDSETLAEGQRESLLDLEEESETHDHERIADGR